MPRTKQNHPKNLKDKIEEAQKELKDPKESQKDVKGLKRKKVVGENQLKKVPKSPVKSKPCNAVLHQSSSKDAPPSHNSSPPPGRKAEPRHVPPDAERPCSEAVKLEEAASPPPRGPSDGEDSVQIAAEHSETPERSRRGDSFSSDAPLDVLLKAMEPDFSTLSERKPVQVHNVPHMPTYYIHKRGTFIGFIGKTSAPGASSPEKPSLHMNFNPPAITHAPTGSPALPQSQPPVVHTCHSLSASVPSTIQVPMTPGGSHVPMAAVVNFGADSKEQKAKKPGKYVCEYCNRACAKPSVLLKHIRSHTGERPYPCVTCGFSFKTKSNLYKHKKSHAHAIKLGLMARSESGGGSQESDKAGGTHSEESSDEEGSAADPDATENTAEADSSGRRSNEPRVTAAPPKVVVYPANVSPLRADSPRVTGAAPEPATAQRQRDFQSANLRSSMAVLSSLREVDGANPSLDAVSEDESQQGKMVGGHAQLQRQQATDFSQQQPPPKCLLSPRSLGSTDSGYFSRSESADQATSPPSPFVKITPPVDADVAKSVLPAAVVAVARVAAEPRPPPLEASARSLEERISKLISDNEAVVDNKQLDSVKPRRTSLSRRGSIDSPKSYIFKDSFQFDLKPPGRRSSSSSDIPKSPFTPTDKSKPVFLLSVPAQYPPMDCLPITRSNSMPTTPGHSALPFNAPPAPHPLRVCQSFDDKISSLTDDVFSSAPPTPNVPSRTLVRQKAVEDFSGGEGRGLPAVRSVDEGYGGPSGAAEPLQRSRSFEHGPDRTRKPQQNKGTMYECETCRNRYRKLENFETHKKFYCSELHGPKNKHVTVKEAEQDVFYVGVPGVGVPGVGVPGVLDQQTSIRKRRKMKSVGDEDDQSPTDTVAPCSVTFEPPAAPPHRAFPQHALMVDQPKNNQPKLPQVVARGANTVDSRLSPIRESQISGSDKPELPRQGSGTSVIRHTNSLSRPNSFETESVDRISPEEKDSPSKLASEGPARAKADAKADAKPAAEYSKQRKEPISEGAASANSTPIHQSRLVRQSNIQVPEILVTEDSDREPESQPAELADKPADQFNWPQRSESLSKLPAEKLPPKKKRIRLAQMEHSSGESSFESSLSRSLSRDSSLSASFDRDEPSRSESPSRGEVPGKIPEPPGLSAAFNTLGVPGTMRRAASEQITCTQPSVEISPDYRSKSFDCGNVSPGRCPSPRPKIGQPPQTAQVPLIERRRGPLVRQMSLKIGPESQPPVRKPLVTQSRCQQIHIASRHPASQPFVLHAAETPPQRDEQTVQSVNLGGPTRQPQVHGLPHPWHQTARVQKAQQPPDQVSVCPENVQNKADKTRFGPKYQLRCPALRSGSTFSFSCAQAAQIALPILTIPIAAPVQNVYVAGRPNQPGTAALPQILITHEHMHPVSSSNQAAPSHSAEADAKTNRTAADPLPGSLQKLASVTLCPQQEPAASSKRMLSPANSLDIYMEKHQKRAKDEHGVACLTDGRSLSYLNSKMSEVTRQRKLMLVRQVCTTEPADSPIETEAPPLPDAKPDEDKDDVKPMSPDAAGLEKRTPEEAGAGTPAASLKPAEEQRWTPKSLIRPSSFQVKLATSVSVVNTKDTHRLSFPSLKTATTFTWCFLMKRKPLHVLQTDLKTSAYTAWRVSPDNPNPLGLPTKVVMSLFDSKQNSKKIQYTSSIRTGGESDILSYSGKLKDVMPRTPVKSGSAETRNQPEAQTDSEKDATPELRRVKIFDGGFKSNEEYVYVRGRGRGKYICEECGIRCKKPSMLRKHIRTHSDVRPYHCVHCNFSFKTKGNLTKHMKSKAHRKKCMEMGVPEGVIEDQDAEDSGDRSHMGSTDRPDSDGDYSDGPDDEENDEEEEEDSQAESGLSTNPSVSASPQHVPSRDAEVPPSALLAQMSISSVSVPMMSPASLSKQVSVSCCSPLPASPPPATSDSYTSDPESVHMMSPVSPCRQMSIDYPDFDGPLSPPVPSRGSKVGQETRPPTSTGDSSSPVDRSTQTSHVPAGPEAHLFSHLPLHSQQPTRSPYSMVPVGGIQLVPAGLATFLPIQAGPVQLTIPAVGVIHRNTSPLPPPNTPPQPEPLVVQEPISSMVPCFPLGQVAGLETLNLMGLSNTGLTPTQLIPQQGLTLNATLGLQVLAANPTPQSSTGLQIVNIALPAIIPALSPLSALSPLPGSSDGPEAPRGRPGQTEAGAAPAGTPTSPPDPTGTAQTKGETCPPDGPDAQTRVYEYNEASSDDEDRLVIAT